MFDLRIPDEWKALPGRRHVCFDESDRVLIWKVCNHCGLNKSEEAYGMRKGGKLRSYCRDCMSAKNIEYQKANRARLNAYQRDRKARLRA